MATWAKPNLDELEERFSPLRPLRLGNRRRKPRGGKAGGSVSTEESATQFLRTSETGDATSTPIPPAFGSQPATQSGITKVLPERSEGAGAKRPHSLDTEKQLATSDRVSLAQELELLKTPLDAHRDKALFHHTLLGSVYRIWQTKELELEEAGFRAGMRSREHFLRNNQTHVLGLEKTDPDFVQAWIDEAKQLSDEASAVLLIAEQERKRWFAQWRQLNDCQKEWIGYRAACCGPDTRPVAVPIHCNHRLCPLCASHRAELARARVRGMFDKLSHPVIITLTTPNLRSIDKLDFEKFRTRVRKFIKAHSWIKGGVYSLETTYNREIEVHWHIHVHILADLDWALPTKKMKVTVAGRRMMQFTDLKMRLEFEWLRLWVGNWGKAPAKNAQRALLSIDEQVYREWLEGTRAHVVREWRGGWRYMDLPADERARRTAWNAANRRNVDIRPVIDREKAAVEVLKYITKVAKFADMPHAIEPFMNAVRGSRLIQTFGSWYGLKLEADANEHDWSEMQCACGCNEWKRMGVFNRDDVQMDSDGRWLLKPGFTDRSDPTIPKARIPYFRDRELRDDERGRVLSIDHAREQAQLENYDVAPKQNHL